MITVAKRASLRTSTVMNLCRMLMRNGRWWLIPVVAVFVVTSLLLTVITAIEYIAPFVYTVF